MKLPEGENFTEIILRLNFSIFFSGAERKFHSKKTKSSLKKIQKIHEIQKNPKIQENPEIQEITEDF